MRLVCKGGEDTCNEFSLATLVDYNLTEYSAKEIRFHTQAEHTIDEREYDMEI